MSFFVTGASGFLGSRLAIRLAEKGEQVYALFRSQPHPDFENYPNIIPVKGDITDFDSIEEPIKKADYVFHTAALATNWFPDHSMFEKVNVQGTINVLEACKKHGVKKVVYTSSVGVIGPQQSDELVNESMPLPQDVFNEYERTKLLAEKQIKKYAAEGLHAMIVSPTRIYGPGPLNTSNVATRLINRFVNEGWRFIPGDGRSVGNYVFIDDVVDLHLRTLEKGTSGERYIAGGENASFDAFFKILSDCINVDRKMIHLGYSSMMVFAQLNKYYTKFFGRPPLVLPADIRKYAYDWGVDSTKAREELGYRPVSLEEGLKLTVDWLQKDKEAKMLPLSS